jgi:2OG-Fe(II) oxygenase superfamily
MRSWYYAVSPVLIFTLTYADVSFTLSFHSGLLYLSTFNVDFTGGRLVFLSDKFPERADLIVEPRAGRTVIFTSGPENTHYVERVTAGNRFVLAFWFTCDHRREFEIFLDGKMHTTFSHRMRAASRKAEDEASATSQSSKDGTKRKAYRQQSSPDAPPVRKRTTRPTGDL